MWIILEHEDMPVPGAAFTIREIRAFEWIGVKTRDVGVRHEPADGGLAPGNGNEMFAVRSFTNEDRKLGFLINNPPRAFVLDLAHRIIELLVVKHEQPVVIEAGKLLRRARAGGGEVNVCFMVMVIAKADGGKTRVTVAVALLASFWKLWRCQTAAGGNHKGGGDQDQQGSSHKPDGASAYSAPFPR